MSESDPIQQLIRLKRHEQPPADFVEDFLGTFHQRQRAELLQQSARGLLWERITTYFEDLMTPKVGWAFATVLAVSVTIFAMMPSSGNYPSVDLAGNVPVKASGAEAMTSSPVTEERYLISGHFKGGLADDLNSRPKSNSALQVDDRSSRVNGSMLPAGLRISDDMIAR
jgi:hypothetical protein